MTEYYDLGNGIIYGVMGGDAIMNAHRREERQAQREAIMKEREQEKVDDYRDRLDELEREEYYESKYGKEQK